MAHVLAQTGLGAVLDNPTATVTGLAGTLVCGALACLMVVAAASVPLDDGLETLPFTPGMVLALGSVDAADVTTPNVAPPTPPTEPAAPTEPTEPDQTDDTPPTPDEAVTEDVTPAQPRPPKPRPPKPTPPRATPPKAPPTPPGLPTPPSAGPSRGDPFGDRNGFDDLQTDGDPWARGVLDALRKMDVGTIYAKPLTGALRFELTICKNGTISRVATKSGTTMSRDERDRVILELSRLKIPRPPPAIAAKMSSSCAKLRHTFVWSEKDAR